MTTIFELIPVAMAFAVAIFSSTAYTKARRIHDRTMLIMATLAAIMLIIAQTSWYSTLTGGGVDDPTWVNNLWTLFNTTVMSAFLINAIGRK